jgi:hypothetical protein
MTAYIYFSFCVPSLQDRNGKYAAADQLDHHSIELSRKAWGWCSLAVSRRRRPVYLLILALRATASLNLALNRNTYAVLAMLHTLQRTGCSETAALTYDVVAYVTMPAIGVRRQEPPQ